VFARGTVAIAFEQVGRVEAVSPYSLSNVLPVTKNADAMYAMCIVRYRKPVEEVVKFQEAHRAYQRRLLDDGTLLAAGPHEPRFGGMFLVRVPDDDPQRALDKIRDDDPYYQAGVAQYELLVWNVVVGKENLEKL
jgi:uncharacterized protein YciI